MLSVVPPLAPAEGQYTYRGQYNHAAAGPFTLPGHLEAVTISSAVV